MGSIDDRALLPSCFPRDLESPRSKSQVAWAGTLLAIHSTSRRRFILAGVNGIEPEYVEHIACLQITETMVDTNQVKL